MSSRSPTAHAARHLRDAHEETHQHPVRDQRGTAVRHEREGDAGERYEPEIPSDDDERLQRHDERQPTGEQLEEHRRGAERDQHSAVEEHEVEGEQGERAGEPGLLSERVEDEVAPYHRYPVRHAVPKTGPEESAVRDGVEALDQLITATESEVQGLYAVTNGGLFGAGLGNGMPDRIPVVWSDFVFDAFAEEAGLAGALALLALYLVFLYRGMLIALRAPTMFLQLLAAGLLFIVALQTLVIVGGNLRLIPLTGITLPFVAYGGSSLVTNWMLVALLLRVSAVPGRTGGAA